ncbi:MAG TPA: LysR substrate-binding domain-containing protein [Caulobacteraceae bacterium]|jgi:DNA-binding transcriptional LysR family regulator
MPDIDDDDIRRLDGGLLLVFRELCRRGRTTAVAAHLGLSQSAVSHALARLRDIFGDPLFLRRPHGLEPTGRAVALAPKVEALIELMSASLRPAPGFDPAGSSRWFPIVATEYAPEALATGLAGRLRAAAPRAGFYLQFTRAYLALDALRRGQVDLALGRFDSLPSGFVGEPLFEDSYCVAARAGHPAICGEIDYATWRRAGHVFVGTFSASDNVIGPAIGEDAIPHPDEVAGVAIVPRWETALAAVAASDAITTAPRSLAAPLAARLGLQLLPLPGEGGSSWTVSIARREGPDAGLDWLCGELRAAAAA